MNNILGVAHRPGSTRSRAMMGVAFSAVALTMVAPGLASAQQAGEVQEITITGTRIKAPNLTSESPVTQVTEQEIKQQGTTNLENLLNDLPEVYASQGNTTSNGSNGTANVNLRGLGVTRTLVLIDGRRVGPGDPQSANGSAADINFIPAGLTTGVEVLTGGASAIYGSDAVAGVVNFHLNRNFNGVMLDEVYSFDQHSQHNSFQNVLRASPYPVSIPSDDFDGFIRDTTAVVGASSADGKGNVTMYGEYRSTTPVNSGSRDWSACSAGSNAASTGLVCAGSSNSAYGRFLTNDGGNYANNPNGTNSFVPFTNALKYNFAPTNYLQRQDDRSSLGAIGHYQVKPWLDVYAEVMFMDDKTTAQIAPSGLFLGGGPTGQLQIACNNPYMSAQQEAVICEDANGNPLPKFQANGQPTIATMQIMPGLRFASFPRQDVLQHDDYRAVLGARGDINDAWTYDVSGSYWDSILSEHYLNDVSFTRLQESALGCQNGNSDGCVPINLFQYGGLTPQAVNFVSAPGEKTGYSREMVANINFTGDLGTYGLKSPFAHNGLATAMGVEYRRDELNYLPDLEFQSGDLLGQGATTPPVSGGEGIEEEYIEVRAPLAEDKPFVLSANLDLAFRHSGFTVDNSNANYSTNTYKIAADYAPTSDVRFRGGYNRAARAPSLYELFLPTSLGNDSGYDDPCGPAMLASKAACIANGLPASKYGAATLSCPAGQCEEQSGGNTALKPEEADTWTWGANFTPEFIKGFNMSVDYWDVKVSNYITTLSGQQIVDGCLQGGVAALCPLIHRAPGSGIIYGTTGYVTETNTNFGFLHNRGLDFEVNYRKELQDLGAGDMGTLFFKMNGTYLIAADVGSLTNYNCAGLYGATCGAQGTTGPLFQWRHQARLTWATPWNLDASINWRYMSSVSLDTNSSQAALNNGSYDAVDGHVNAYNYIDLALAYHLWEKYTFRFGVNNVTDKDPPVFNQAVLSAGGGTNGNTYPGVYDALGRVFFTSFNAKF